MVHETANETVNYHFVLFTRDTNVPWTTEGNHHWTDFNGTSVDIHMINEASWLPIFGFVTDAEAYCEHNDLDLRIRKVRIVIDCNEATHYAVLDYDPSNESKYVIGQSRGTEIPGDAYLYASQKDALDYMITLRHYGIDMKPFVAPVKITILDELQS